jgi:hypothetical protein
MSAPPIVDLADRRTHDVVPMWSRDSGRLWVRVNSQTHRPDRPGSTQCRQTLSTCYDHPFAYAKVAA